VRVPISSIKQAKFRHGTAGLRNEEVSLWGRGETLHTFVSKATRPEFGAVRNYRQPRRFHRFQVRMFEGSHGETCDRLCTSPSCEGLRGSPQSASSPFEPGVRFFVIDDGSFVLLLPVAHVILENKHTFDHLVLVDSSYLVSTPPSSTLTYIFYNALR
jgi:hypothetical protein